MEMGFAVLEDDAKDELIITAGVLKKVVWRMLEAFDDQLCPWNERVDWMALVREEISHHQAQEIVKAYRLMRSRRKHIA